VKKVMFVALMILAIGGNAEAKRPITFNFGVHSKNFGVFYSSLSPYGEWIQMHGGYVWRPVRVSHGWRPYLNGNWTWTDYGWYWVSSEPFGWATFHYGRWYYDDYYGWIWIPDDTWGPAWVEWRYDNDNIGWAPLTPYVEFRAGVGIIAGERWVSPLHYWNFVPGRYFTARRIADYIQPADRARVIFGNTRASVNIQFDNHRIVNRGVDVHFVEQRTNSRINRVDVVAHPMGNGERITHGTDRVQIETVHPRFGTVPHGQQIHPQVFRHDQQRTPAVIRPQPRQQPEHNRNIQNGRQRP